MNFALSAALYSIALFAGMIVFGEMGRRVARRRAARDPEGAWQGIGVIDGALFALLGLVIAFTFSGAASRFEGRRHLIVDETNAIGTAYLRLDLLPAESQEALRDRFKRYLDTRLAVYERLPDLAAAHAELENSNRIQAEIWAETLTAARGIQPATMLLVPALNENVRYRNHTDPGVARASAAAHLLHAVRPVPHRRRPGRL